MKRVHYIAAEMFGYSYENYYDKVTMGHIRFTKYMPDDVKAVEQAEQEEWSNERLAKKLNVSVSKLEVVRAAYIDAVKLVDAGDSVDKYIEGVIQSVKNAVEIGLKSEVDINQLVSQILYRTSDLSFLLREEEDELWTYSEKLRDWEK